MQFCNQVKAIFDYHLRWTQIQWNYRMWELPLLVAVPEDHLLKINFGLRPKCITVIGLWVILLLMLNKFYRF